MKRTASVLLVLAAWLAGVATANAAADEPDSLLVAVADSVAPFLAEDTDTLYLGEADPDGLFLDGEAWATPTRRDWSKWRPSAKRAMWLAIVLPGAGQIYNRKYWKLPIVYGGVMGCIYAMRWNNMMYRDYSQAYMDIMDDNPETQSYNQFLHLGRTIDATNMETYQNKFKRRKDYYRRYRDMSAFILIGVYAVSVIDAYVDASLSEFDISDDLSLRIAPSVVTGQSLAAHPLKTSGLGLRCTLRF